MQSAQKSCSKQSSGAGSLSIVSSTLMGGVDIEKLCFSKVVGDQPLSGSFGDLLHNLTAVFQPVETLPGHINYMVSGS